MPGGRLVAQCGGEGNIAPVVRAIETMAPAFPEIAGWPGPWRFAGPRETEAALRRAGFEAAWAWLTEVVVHPEDLRAYLASVVLGSHLERLPPDRHDAFVAAVGGELERPEVRYVRLNLLARRPA